MKIQTLLISDLFKNHVVEWVRLHTLTEDFDSNSPTFGEIVIPLSNLFFLHSSINELNDYMSKLIQGKLENKKFPFIWIDNGKGNVIYKVQGNVLTVTVKQMLIGTKSDNKYLSDQRTEKVFKPILVPLAENVMRRLDNNGGHSYLLDQLYESEHHYFYGKDKDSNPFKDFIDVIEIKNFKLELNNC